MRCPVPGVEPSHLIMARELRGERWNMVEPFHERPGCTVSPNRATQVLDVNSMGFWDIFRLHVWGFNTIGKEVWLGRFERFSLSCQLYCMVLIVSIIPINLWNKVKIEDTKLSQLPSEQNWPFFFGGSTLYPEISSNSYHQKISKNDGPWKPGYIYRLETHMALFFELVSNQHFSGVAGLRICQRTGR